MSKKSWIQKIKVQTTCLYSSVSWAEIKWLERQVDCLDVSVRHLNQTTHSRSDDTNRDNDREDFKSLQGPDSEFCCRDKSVAQ